MVTLPVADSLIETYIVAFSPIIMSLAVTVRFAETGFILTDRSNVLL